jgi:hypothetical protein
MKNTDFPDISLTPDTRVIPLTYLWERAFIMATKVLRYNVQCSMPVK